MLTYEECLKKLYSLTKNGSELGLERIQNLLYALDNPHKHIRAVHVAGTNGKGSVSTKIAKSYELEGLLVGLYTSPHIATFRERIQINGKKIEEEEVSALLNRIFPLTRSESFFEITTALMFLYFYKKKVDVAVLETGLGGRLDATNVCYPILSIITSISLDHTQYLGATIEAITREKAGIIKPSVPVIIGPGVAYDLIALKTNKSLITQVTGAFASFEDENRSIARCAQEKLHIVHENALQAVPPCRFERHSLGGKELIFDVAHNVDGIKKLFERLDSNYPKKSMIAIYGASKDKDVAQCLLQFVSRVAAVYFVEAPTERSVNRQELLALTPAHLHIKCHALSSYQETITAAFSGPEEIVVIFGTFFIMAPIRKALGFYDESDSMVLIEGMRYGNI